MIRTAALIVTFEPAAFPPEPVITSPVELRVSVWLFAAPAPIVKLGLVVPPLKLRALTVTPPAPRSMVPPPVAKVAVSPVPGTEAGGPVQLLMVAHRLPSAAAPDQVALAAWADPVPNAIKASAAKPKAGKNEAVGISGMDFIRVSGCDGFC